MATAGRMESVGIWGEGNRASGHTGEKHRPGLPSGLGHRRGRLVAGRLQHVYRLLGNAQEAVGDEAGAADEAPVDVGL